MNDFEIFAFYGSALAFWFSLAVTEGWKWRVDAGRPDDNWLVVYHSYHLWRSLTTLSVVALILMSPGNVLPTLLALLSGWSLYERTMSYVEHDDWHARRGRTWHLVKGVDIPRLPPIADFLISAAAGAAYFWNYYA
jgi:hypothetical protein